MPTNSFEFVLTDDQQARFDGESQQALDEPGSMASRVSWAGAEAHAEMADRFSNVDPAVQAGFSLGILDEDDVEFIEQQGSNLNKRTAANKLIGYRTKGSALENAVAFVDTVTGLRLVRATIAGASQGVKDIGGFGIGFSPEEFQRSWNERESIGDVTGKFSGRSVGFVEGLAWDVLLDPTTWLTAGVSAGVKVAVRSGVFSENVVKSGSRQLSTYGEKMLKMAASRWGDEQIENVMRNAGVTAADSVLPEHFSRLMENIKSRESLVEYTIRNFDVVSHDVAKLSKPTTKGGPKAFVPGYGFRPVEYLDDVANMKRGPESMFVRNDGPVMRRDLSRIGIVPIPLVPGNLTRQLQYSVGAATKKAIEYSRERGGYVNTADIRAKLRQDKIDELPDIYENVIADIGEKYRSADVEEALLSGDIESLAKMKSKKSVTTLMDRLTGASLSDEADKLVHALDNGEVMFSVAELEALSSNWSSNSWRIADSVIGWAGSKTYGAIDTMRRMFNASIELAPMENRVMLGKIHDRYTAEMHGRAFAINKYANETFVDDGTGLRQLSGAEMEFVSQHLDNPRLYADVPSHIAPVVEWTKNQFKLIAKAEEGLGLKTIDDYVTHIYGGGNADKIADYLSAMRGEASRMFRINRGTAVARNDFSLQRTIAYLDDAIDLFGSDKVELNAFNILHHRWKVSSAVRMKQTMMEYAVSEYGIRGAKDMFIFEREGMDRLMRVVNYGNSLTLGSQAAISGQTAGRIESAVKAASRLDLSRMNAKVRRSESGKLISHGPWKVKHTRVMVDSGGKETLHRAAAYEDEHGEFFVSKIKGKYYRVTGSGRKRAKERLDWFVSESLHEQRAKSAKDLASKNMARLDGIVQHFGRKSVNDLTEAEGDIVATFFEHMTGTRRSINEWGGFDRLERVKISSHKMIREAGFYEAGDSGRLIPAGSRRKDVSFSDKDIARMARKLSSKTGAPESDSAASIIASAARRNAETDDIPMARSMSKSERAALEKSLSEHNEALDSLKRMKVESERFGQSPESMVADADNDISKLVAEVAMLEKNLDGTKRAARRLLGAKNRLDKAWHRRDGIGAAISKKLELEGQPASIDEIRARSSDLEESIARIDAAESAAFAGLDGEYIMPKSIIDAVNEAVQSPFDPSNMLHRGLKAWQDFHKYFKIPLTLPFSDYWSRNLVGNAGLATMRLGFRMLSPANWKPVPLVVGHILSELYSSSSSKIAAMSGGAPRKIANKFADMEIDIVDGRKLRVKEVADAAILRGINHAFVWDDIKYSPFQMFGGLHRGMLLPATKAIAEAAGVGMSVGRQTSLERFVGKASPSRLMSGVVGKVSATGETFVDTPFRIAMFVDAVRLGASYDEAAETVRKYLNDYSRLSPFEKRWMKTAIPFYSFIQFSLENAFDEMASSPGKFALPIRGFEHMSSSDNEEYEPQWLDSQLSISEQTKSGYVKSLVGFGISHTDAVRQAESAFVLGEFAVNVVTGKPATTRFPDESPLRFLAQMDFISKSIAELAIGKEMLTGESVGSPLHKSVKTRLDSGKPYIPLPEGTGVTGVISRSAAVDALRNWLEYRVDDSGEAHVNEFKRWLIGQTPVSRIVNTFERSVKNIQSAGADKRDFTDMAVEALGASAYYWHPSEQRYYKDKARLEAMAELLRRTKLLHDFNILSPSKGDKDIIDGMKNLSNDAALIDMRHSPAIGAAQQP